MGINLNSVATKSATAQITYLGEKAKVVYDPSLITANNAAAEETLDAFLVFFCKLVKSWDVTNGSKKVPLTTAALKDIPVPFLRSVYRQIVQGGLEDAAEEGKA